MERPAARHSHTVQVPDPQAEIGQAHFTVYPIAPIPNRS